MINPLQAATRGRLTPTPTKRAAVLALAGLLAFGSVQTEPQPITGRLAPGHYRTPQHYSTKLSPTVLRLIASRSTATVTRYAIADSTTATLESFTSNAVKVLQSGGDSVAGVVSVFRANAEIDRSIVTVAALVRIDALATYPTLVRFAAGTGTDAVGIAYPVDVEWYRVPVLVNRRLAKVTPSQMPIAIPVKLATRIDPMLAELMNADV